MSLAKQPWLRQRKAVELERLLYAIVIHGAGVAYEERNARSIDWMRRYWWHGYCQVQEALREAKRRPRHSMDCTCWDCLLRMHGWWVRKIVQLEMERDVESQAATTEAAE